MIKTTSNGVATSRSQNCDILHLEWTLGILEGWVPPRKSLMDLSESTWSQLCISRQYGANKGWLADKNLQCRRLETFFFDNYLGFRRADDSRANPTFEEQKLETDSCKKWRGGQVGHIYNKVDTDRWVLKRSMTTWPIIPCRTLPRTRTALKEDHGCGGNSKELGDMEL